MMSPNDERGITLVELMVALAIVGILMVALGFSFQGWRSKYKVEAEIKQMHADLMQARAQAMQHKRVHCVDLSAYKYTLWEDTDPAPDGDGACTASDMKLVEENTEHKIIYGGTLQYVFSDEGVLATSGVVRLEDPEAGQVTDADFDCLVLDSTRVSLGAWDGTNCNVK